MHFQPEPFRLDLPNRAIWQTSSLAQGVVDVGFLFTASDLVDGKLLRREPAEGTFPRQAPISVNGAGWHESAVNRWIADPAGYRAEDVERRS
jgi:hypothetical protein